MMRVYMVTCALLIHTCQNEFHNMQPVTLLQREGEGGPKPLWRAIFVIFVVSDRVRWGVG